jgi:hypothetical protein
MEHAEHAEHAAHDPFDKRVALTIAVVAAILASVTVLAHRAHTDTLLLYGISSSKSNESFNKWSLYQAQKIRQHVDKDSLQLLNIVALRDDGADDKKKVVADLKSQIAHYNEELPKWKKEAEQLTTESKEKAHDSHAMHERASRYDLGELFVEVALVLCSIAILTKRKSFWFSGIGVCVLGALITVTGMLGLFMSERHGGHDAGHHSEQKDDSH